MESEKSKVEALFEDIERRLAETSKLTVADRRRELQQMDPAIVVLTREFERFQMIGFNKYPNEIDEMEDRLAKIKSTVTRMMNEDVTISVIDNEPKLNESDIVAEEYDPTKQLVDQTNAKLAEGKARAQNMLRIANNMRDELNMIDDEVMLQREKLVSINAQIKHAQSVTNQTKKLVNYFTKAVNDDKIVKGLIGVVAVILLIIVVMGVRIKMKRGQLKELKMEQEKVLESQADYSKIDEAFFYKLSKGIGHGKKDAHPPGAHAAAAVVKEVKQTPQAGEAMPTAETKPDEGATTPETPEGDPRPEPETTPQPETVETPQEPTGGDPPASEQPTPSEGSGEQNEPQPPADLKQGEGGEGPQI